MSLSILIPTHNRSELLSRTLESLCAVTLPPSGPAGLEIVIIANACTDQTRAIVEQIAPTMPIPTRCVEEPTVGLNPARNRALAEARGEILAFLDDDVWVEPTWLIELLAIFDAQPADIVAGTVDLWWEAVERPAWLDTRSAHLLSCVNYGDQIIELTKPGQAVGANFAFRRRVTDHIGAFTVGLDRTGDTTLAGGDTDFLARALDAGHRMFYAPRAIVKHWVSPQRITPEYLGRVAYANGLARAFLRKNFSVPRALRTFIEHGFRLAVYTAVGGLTAIFGPQKAHIHNRIRLMTSRGNLTGAYRRLRHRSPSGAKR